MYQLIETQDKSIFFQLLFNEHLCSGDIAVPDKWIREAGGINHRLGSKRKYELMLRIAQIHGYTIQKTDIRPAYEHTVLKDEPETSIIESLKTDCYMIARYSKLLQERGEFDVAVSEVLAQSSKLGCQEEVLVCLEGMLKRERGFCLLEEAVSPVLIYKGSGVCNNLLNIFAEQFGNALEEQGILVEYFDESREPITNLTRYIGRYFRAVFGVQTYLFQIKMADGVTFFHDKINGPKIHLVLDHPIWMKNQLLKMNTDYYILSHDRNYARFIEQFYHIQTVHFPIPGIQKKEQICQKIYDLTFVGAMGDYRQQIYEVRKMDRWDRFLANRFLTVMRKEKNLSAEQAFQKVYEFYRCKYEPEEFLETFYKMRKLIYLVMDYYRYKILETILDNGIIIDVFGDSWKDSKLAEKYPNLICHPSVTVEESLEIYAQSKISLNVMSWHKDGFTERVANIMLSHTVLLTDWTRYLEENYKNGQELLMFSLDELGKLPDIITDSLQKPQMLEQIAEAGYAKTKVIHTWKYQTKQILHFLDFRR